MAAEVHDTGDQLVRDHLWLVRGIVRSMTHVPRTVDRDDMESVGYIALIECARRFDDSKRVPFKSYAKRRIEGAIQDYLRKLDWCPRSVRTAVRAAKAAQDAVGYGAPLEAIADELGITKAKLKENIGKAAKGRIRSLDMQVSEEVDLPLYEVIVDRTAKEIEADVLLDEWRCEVERLLNILNEQQRIVIRRTFFEGAKLHMVGEELGVTESRISQIRTAALRSLRAHIEATTGS